MRSTQNTHLFTAQDIQRLLAASAQLHPVGSIRPITYTTLFALLAATGLRISEAIALDINDVTEDGLFIRSTKFRKDRLVPLHDSARLHIHRYMEYRCVSCLDQSRRIQAIPTKKIDEKIVVHLTRSETEALLAAPDPRTTAGVRDRAMLMLCVSTGLRVSELLGLSVEQVELGSQSTIHVIGKGRKERVLPLWNATASALKTWLAIRPDASTVRELFLNAQGYGMTRSGFEYILTKHAKTAAQQWPALGKKKISPHVLRHTCAMNTLKATHDIRKVSLAGPCRLKKY